MSKIKSIRLNPLLYSFWILGVISFGIRAFINFSQDLLNGNGGYYPLQVRTLIERGELAFPDMPFLFYLDAGIVRLFNLFGLSTSNELIINVVKSVDSISIPLLLVPLYKLLNLNEKRKFSSSIIAISAFAVLSFHTLNLTSSFQKNAIAIFLFVATHSLFMNYLTTRNSKFLVIAIIFFFLIGLTHFGTFAFALIFGTLFLIFWFKKKAFLPITILIGSAPLLIYAFDPVRYFRLLLAWKDLFSKLPPPSQLLLTLAYIIIAVLAIQVFRKFKGSFNEIDKAIISTLIALLFIIPLPIIDPQATSRMSTYLFIPIVLLLYKFNPLISERSKKIVSISLILISLGSICFLILMHPPEDVSKKSLEDMAKMKSFIPNPEQTVIVARHNLEFWVAWELKVDVSQESKFNKTLINEYDDIFIINQIRDKGPGNEDHRGDKNRERNHMDEPLIPISAALVYSSEYFKLYRYKK